MGGAIRGMRGLGAEVLECWMARVCAKFEFRAEYRIKCAAGCAIGAVCADFRIKSLGQVAAGVGLYGILYKIMLPSQVPTGSYDISYSMFVVLGLHP